MNKKYAKFWRFEILDVKGVLYPNLKLACFVSSLKIINTFIPPDLKSKKGIFFLHVCVCVGGGAGHMCVCVYGGGVYVCSSLVRLDQQLKKFLAYLNSIVILKFFGWFTVYLCISFSKKVSIILRYS